VTAGKKRQMRPLVPKNEKKEAKVKRKEFKTDKESHEGERKKEKDEGADDDS